jgi:hypothetical protein
MEEDISERPNDDLREDVEEQDMDISDSDDDSAEEPLNRRWSPTRQLGQIDPNVFLQ